MAERSVIQGKMAPTADALASPVPIMNHRRIGCDELKPEHYQALIKVSFGNILKF